MQLTTCNARMIWNVGGLSFQFHPVQNWSLLRACFLAYRLYDNCSPQGLGIQCALSGRGLTAVLSSYHTASLFCIPFFSFGSCIGSLDLIIKHSFQKGLMNSWILSIQRYAKDCDIQERFNFCGQSLVFWRPALCWFIPWTITVTRMDALTIYSYQVFWLN